MAAARASRCRRARAAAVGRQRRRGELQGDAPAERRVLRQEDFAHAAFAELVEDLKRPMVARIGRIPSRAVTTS